MPFGIGQNFNFYCKPGKHNLKFLLNLPHMALGLYYIDLFVVESFVKRHASFFNISSFEVSSSFIPSTGWSFEKYAELGSILHFVKDLEYNAISSEL